MIEKIVFRALIHSAEMWIVNRYLGLMLWIIIMENEKLKDQGAKVRRSCCCETSSMSIGLFFFPLTCTVKLKKEMVF